MFGLCISALSLCLSELPGDRLCLAGDLLFLLRALRFVESLSMMDPMPVESWLLIASGLATMLALASDSAPMVCFAGVLSVLLCTLESVWSNLGSGVAAEERRELA